MQEVINKAKTKTMKNKRLNTSEERLSPKARMLLEGTRRKFSHCPRMAIQYLRSVNPEELTMYDRQKIGREILARAPYTRDALNRGIDSTMIREAYDLPAVDENGERIKPLEGKKRLQVYQNARKFEKEMIFNMERAKTDRTVFWYGSTYESNAREWFEGAVRAYTTLGKNHKVIECYDLRIKYLTERLASRFFSRDLPRSIKPYEEEREAFIKKTKSKDLEKTI
jgi:hypothetical protein